MEVGQLERKPRSGKPYEPYAAIFGDTVQVRVIGYFLTNGNNNNYATKIARACNVDRVSAHRALSVLLKHGVIRRKKEKVGQIVMYDINSRNPHVQQLQVSIPIQSSPPA